MRRNLGLAILAFSLTVVFIAGCGGTKEVLKEDSAKSPAMAAPAGPVEKAASAEKAEAKTKFTVLEPVPGKPATAGAADVQAGAAQRKAEAAAVSVKELYELADILFDFDKFNLKDEARVTLKKHAEWLNKNKDVRIVVEGHCDERGTAEYNLALGERRANAAAKFLVDMGIDAKRIKVLSYGEELPLDKGHDEAAWARNRRAHFDASGKK